MRFGFALPQIGSVAGPEALVTVAKRAEDLGYDSLWILDELFTFSEFRKRENESRLPVDRSGTLNSTPQLFTRDRRVVDGVGRANLFPARTMNNALDIKKSRPARRTVCSEAAKNHRGCECTGSRRARELSGSGQSLTKAGSLLLRFVRS